MAISSVAARCSSCARALKVRASLAGKQVKCPECGKPVRVPSSPSSPSAGSPPPTRSRNRMVVAGLLIGSLGVASCLIVILIAARYYRPAQPGPAPDLPAVARPKASFMEIVVGNRRIDGIDDDGFHYDESNNAIPFRWTNGDAKLIVPLDLNDPPRLLLVRLGQPKKNGFQIKLNGKLLAKEPATGEKSGMVSWERTFDLTGIDIGDMAVLELISDTVVPAKGDPKSTDFRDIGVQVHAVQFLRREKPLSFLDVPLGNRIVPGLEESGFHPEQKGNGGAFRWTKGSAKLIVPLDPKDPPRSLFVRLHRPERNWLQINLNGKQLVKEPAISEKTDMVLWERTIDLTGIDIGNKAIFELLSDTWVPAKTDPKSTDDRALGVRLFAVTFQRQLAEKPPPSFLDIPLGNRIIPGLEEAGFYDEQQYKGGSFRWTNGNAKLVIPLDGKARPKALNLFLHREKGSWLRVSINQRELLNEPAAETEMYWYERTLDLAGIDFGQTAVVEIASTPTVRPGDTQAHGVKVRSIKLLTAVPMTSYVDMPLGGQFVHGVQESGMLEQEFFAGQLVRWTNGSARFTVPLGDKKPQALSLTAYIRTQGSKVRVIVNGKKLFDAPAVPKGAWPNSIWSINLPLAGVELGESARIEIDSNVVVPAKVDPKSKDDRTLGIRLKQLILLSDAGAGE